MGRVGLRRTRLRAHEGSHQPRHRRERQRYRPGDLEHVRAGVLVAGDKIWHEGIAKIIQGIGFVLTAGDPYVGYDFDGVRDPETNEIEEWALREVRQLGSYTEVSPSGRGFRVIGRGKLPGKGGPRKTEDDHALEVYDRERFLTLTGHRLTTPETTTKESA